MKLTKGGVDTVEDYWNRFVTQNITYFQRLCLHGLTMKIEVFENGPHIFKNVMYCVTNRFL